MLVKRSRQYSGTIQGNVYIRIVDSHWSLIAAFCARKIKLDLRILRLNFTSKIIVNLKIIAIFIDFVTIIIGS